MVREGADSYQGMDDRSLITAVVGGDPDAAATLLIERCGSRLKYLGQYKFSMLHLQFEEIVSEVYVALSRNDWRALRQFRGGDPGEVPCSLESYVSVIAARLLWKKLERAVKEIDWKAAPIHQDGLQVSDDRCVRFHNAAEVLDAILSLENPADRELLLRYKIEGVSTEEMAQHLGISPANVYTRCSRAIKMLRDRVEKGGGHA